MFDDDNAARHALQSLNDEPAPPLVTTLDEVMRRGRRRVLVQRVGAVAAVVAVVAGIGVGAVLLRSGDHNGGVQVGSTTEPPVSPRNTALPGWQQVDLPAGMTVVGADDCSWSPKQGRLPPPESAKVVDVPSRELLLGAVGQVDAQLLRSQESTSGKAPSFTLLNDGITRTGIWIEIPTDRSVGMLLLDAGLYGGTPEQAADHSVVAYGNCTPPRRRVLADGTVLQLYPVHLDPQQPFQALHVFRPNGHTYRLVSIGSVDLPVTETQLVAVAEELLPKLG